jgi:hypothetical protein
MKKTKTYSFEKYMIIPINPETIKDKTKVELYNKPLADNNLYAKVTLTYEHELPEKKITMSESEFMQLYKDLCREAYTQKNAGDMWEPNKYMEYALKFEDQ